MTLEVNKRFSHKLSVDNLSCVAGGRTLFSARSFRLSAGELLAVDGANGSGKSCLLRSLCGCVKFARAGSRVFWNERLIALAELTRECMRVGHNAPFLAGLSLFENLQFWSDIFAKEAAASPDKLPLNSQTLNNLAVTNLGRASTSFALSSFWHKPTWRLSAGQKQRGALSMLALKPQASLWLLDEPHAALDADARASLTDCIESHLSDGGMAIVASHEDLSATAQHRLTLCD